MSISIRSLSPVVPAPLLVLGSVVCVQFGQALGKTLFDATGPAGVVALRLGFAALVLLAVYRPRIPRNWETCLLIAGFGTAIAGMNVIFFALAYLPLGVAATLQLLGPLAVAVAGSRRRLDVIWSIIAASGVFLFTTPDSDAATLPLLGVGLALLSGASMGAYVLLSKRVGTLFIDGSGLALAVGWAALLFVPVGVVQNGASLLEINVILGGLGVALLSAVIPYSLELVALRHLPSRIVGVLQSLEPVAGSIAGLWILGEMLTTQQYFAIACVTVASIGVVVTSRKRAMAG